MTHRPIQQTIKRVFDVVVSLASIVLLFPFLLALLLLIRWKLGGPALFRQQRIGLHEKPFHILKFRTMTDERDSQGRLLPDEERMHPLGDWIRSWSLDELPQLWNILWGKMSLVGPRPLVIEDLPHQLPDERIRHRVRPGVTGLAQIAGRNTVGWDERFRIDREYVENWSLWLDAKILWKTIPFVLRREGIRAEGHPTMPRLHAYRASAPKEQAPPMQEPIVLPRRQRYGA